MSSLLLALLLSAPLAATTTDLASAAPALPTLFEANHGAYHPAARFVAHRGPVHAYARDDGLVLRLDGDQLAVALRARFQGGSPSAPLGLDPLPTRVHHLRGGTPADWLSDAPSVSRLRWSAVWPGIDVELYEAPGGFEYDLVLAPGADLSAAVLTWRGQRHLRLDDGGALVMDTAAGPLVQAPPVVRLPDGRQVPGRFVLHGMGRVGFAVDGHDTSAGLVVDPVLAFAAPSPAPDVAHITAGPDGSVYVLGDTTLPDLPTSTGVLQEDLSAGRDLWIGRLDHSGHLLRWLTYLGGDPSNETGIDLEVAPDGSLIVGCLTSGQGFPTTPGAHDTTSMGRGSAVASLTPEGDALNWSSYVVTTDYATADLIDLELTDTGAVVLGGETCPCSDLAFSAGAARTTSSKTNAAFVARLASDGSGMEMATLIDDGNASSFGQYTLVEALDVDGAGRVVVLGKTNHTTVTTADAYQPGKPGNNDYFVTVVSEDGTTYDYSSYLGSSGLEWWEGAAMVLDGQGRVWAAWSSESAAAPLTGNAWQATPGGGVDMVVTCLDPALDGAASLVFSSYLGSWGNEEAQGAGRTADGTLVFGFGTDSIGVDHSLGAPGGNYGRFVLAEIDPVALTLGDLTQVSFNGGEGFAGRLAVTPGGDVLLCGSSNAPAPIAAGTAGGAANNGSFIAKVALDRPWMDLGRGYAGSAGTPRLVGNGDLTPGSPLTLSVTDALPGALACVAFGISFDDLPCKGGLLVTDPSVVLPLLIVDGAGGLTIPQVWPANAVPGVSAYAQVWVQDGGAPNGYAASNGVKATGL